MKQLFMLICLALTIGCNGHAQQYTLDTHESTVQWTGKAAFQTYSLSGTLSTASGKLTMQENQPLDGTVVMDMTSLASDSKQLKTHLRSKDFFEVDRFGEATFVLSRFDSTINVVYGELTIKEKSLPYSFPIHLERKSNQVVIRGTLVIDRTDFDITFNSPSYFEKLKEQAIADDFELEVDLRFKELKL